MTQTTNSSISVTIPNPTAAQIEALTSILAGNTTTAATGVGQNETLAKLATQGRTKSKKTASKKNEPLKTVSEDEDEDFGDEAIDEDELDTQSSDDPADFEEEEDEEEETLDWATVKKAINAFGAANKKGMLAIYGSFNVKSSQELKSQKSKWEPVYRKVMAQLKKSKR